MSSKCDTLIHVDNLPPYIRREDVEDLFFKLGKVTLGELKDHKTPTHAFVEFYDSSVAEDAVLARDGYDYHGFRLKVEFSRDIGPREFETRNEGPSSSGRGPPASQSQCRVFVTGLPPTGSWQDLKNHMKEAGNVCFAWVYNDGTGTVEFLRYEDMKYAVKKLNCSRFQSHQWETSYIRVREDHSEGEGYDDPPKDRSGSHEKGGFPSRSCSQYYRVLVTGLPPTGSWQDLKDHMRDAGSVSLALVYNDGTGVVEFLRYEDMKYAVNKLNGSRFQSHQGETSYIRVREGHMEGGG